MDSAERLKAWLLDEVYPRWSVDGVDARNGGFVESIESDGSVKLQTRRLRVQARQVFAFAQASGLGWRGDSAPLIRNGLAYLTDRYQRADGLFCTLVDAHGRVLDRRALLYDQAFVLLAYAAAGAALDELAQFEQRARTLRGHIERWLRAGTGEFYSDAEHSPHWESNPHMHLLEACLAWGEIGSDAEWHDWADDIIGLLNRGFQRRDQGLIGERYALNWRPSPGLAGRIVEPGHQFEWAWLLLRAQRRHGPALLPVALQLIERAELFGVKNGLALNALLDDLSVHDAGARLWPQTERLKAALLIGMSDDEPRHVDRACSAAQSILTYLNRDTSGLWFDLKQADGQTLTSASPASTLYHLVGAIVELQRTLG